MRRTWRCFGRSNRRGSARRAATALDGWRAVRTWPACAGRSDAWHGPCLPRIDRRSRGPRVADAGAVARRMRRRGPRPWLGGFPRRPVPRRWYGIGRSAVCGLSGDNRRTLRPTLRGAPIAPDAGAGTARAGTCSVDSSASLRLGLAADRIEWCAAPRRGPAGMRRWRPSRWDARVDPGQSAVPYSRASAMANRAAPKTRSRVGGGDRMEMASPARRWSLAPGGVMRAPRPALEVRRRRRHPAGADASEANVTCRSPSHRLACRNLVVSPPRAVVAAEGGTGR